MQELELNYLDDDMSCPKTADRMFWNLLIREQRRKQPDNNSKVNECGRKLKKVISDTINT